MIKPSMSHAVDRNHLNELLVKYYQNLEKLRDEAPFYQWFDDLSEGEQKTISGIMEKLDLPAPREYSSAAYILIDIDRVTHL